jgi:inositol-phosphate phosphatase / L-galactose 1-phosphate phosphatase / histidinol-phosphatase
MRRRARGGRQIAHRAPEACQTHWQNRRVPGHFGAMKRSDLDKFASLAERLADESGAIVKRYFRTGVAVDDKADASPVTVADRESEAAMRALIEATFPDHGIVGEEFGPARPDAPYVWVLDPIDGTKSFVSGKPLYGTLIALLREGKPILGVINHPSLGERWIGVDGRPTLFNGTPARTRACESLAKAVVYTTSPYMFANAHDAAAYERVRKATKFAVFGGDCFAYALVASGWADLVVESGLKPFDFCALVPVIEGAGGRITDWQNRPLSLQSDGRVVAAGDRRSHAEALARLAG